MTPFFVYIESKHMYVSANHDTKNSWSQIWHQQKFNFQKVMRPFEACILQGEGDKLKIFTFYIIFWILKYGEGPNHVREDKHIEIDLW